MSKRQQDDFLDAATELAERFTIGDDDLPLSDVRFGVLTGLVERDGRKCQFTEAALMCFNQSEQEQPAVQPGTFGLRPAGA